MTGAPLEILADVFEQTIAAHVRFAASGLPALTLAASAISRALADRRQVLAFGNGGSAGDAQHFVAELVGRFERERRALPAIALTSDSSVLTAVANDYGYDRVFERQLEALARKGDVAFGISTSGRSRNVEKGLATARAIGLTTIAMTGRDGGPMGRNADIHLNVPESSTARIQEVHRTILHAICLLIERDLES